MSVTDETYVSAYRGILAAKGDSVNNINEIGGDLTAGSLYNILGYNVGVLKNILNEFAYEVNGTTISIKNGQAICYGYVGKIDSTIDFTLTAPSATDKYYFIVADFDLKSATVADFSIGLFNNNNSSSYTPTHLDNLNENNTGRYQYKLYMIKIDTSSVITITDLRDIKESVKNAENAENAENLTGTIENNVTAITQSLSDNSKKVATTEFVVNNLNNMFLPIKQSLLLQLIVNNVDYGNFETYFVGFGSQKMAIGEIFGTRAASGLRVNDVQEIVINILTGGSSTNLVFNYGFLTHNETIGDNNKSGIFYDFAVRSNWNEGIRQLLMLAENPGKDWALNESSFIRIKSVILLNLSAPIYN